MKIAIKYEFMGTSITENVSDYVAVELDDARHDGGVMPDAEQTVENIRKAFGRLIEVLAVRGLLNADDVVKITEDNPCYEYARLHTEEV